MQPIQPLAQELRLENTSQIGECMHVGPQRLPFPISQEQKARIDRNIKNIYFVDGCKRVFNFYKDNNDHALILKENVGYTTRIFGNIGGYVGGFVALALLAPQAAAAFTAIEMVGYVMAGLVLGGAGGALVGTTLAASVTILYDVQTDPYCEWMKSDNIQNVYPIFERVVLDERTQLRQFTCPITEKLILCPYRTKQGQVFEKKAIITWLQERKRAGEDTEYNGEIIGEKDLRYDWMFNTALYRHLIKILDTNVELYRQYIPEEAREGLMAFKDSIKTSSKEILGKLKNINRNLWDRGIISEEELHERNEEIECHYRTFHQRNN
jgi:hypothetical protein